MIMEEIQSVSELTLEIKRCLEGEFPAVRVKGEVSNYRLPSSGHVYMTLKDDKSQIPAVIWKNLRMRLPFELRDGLELVVSGRIELYPPSGRYQLICTSLTTAGEGELQQAFARLLQKLTTAGYFNAEHKKPLPSAPERIGLITSLTGAVIRDMSDVFRRRFPAAALQLYPVKVQGDGAVENIVEALHFFNAGLPTDKRPEVLIVARGGGSLEDLQAFNEEAVAMAIFNSSIPVISAVGHETDVTIADMVADVRAGTPSIAAELAVPETTELLGWIDNWHERQKKALKTRIEGAEKEIASLLGSYAFNRPRMLCDRMEEQLVYLKRYMSQSAGGKLRHAEQMLLSAGRHLDVLDYRKILDRGFALVKNDKGYITRGKGLGEGDPATIVFADTEIDVSVTHRSDGNGRENAPAQGLRRY